jgi:hypothetical protein
MCKVVQAFHMEKAVKGDGFYSCEEEPPAAYHLEAV